MCHTISRDLNQQYFHCIVQSSSYLYQYNEINLLFLFLFLSIFQTSEINKHVNTENLSINSFSLFTCKLVIWKRLVWDQSTNSKRSSLLYWYNRRPLFVILTSCFTNSQESISFSKFKNTKELVLYFSELAFIGANLDKT